jgi:prevent-host-death family protein
MTTVSFTDARNRLAELLDEVERTHDRIEITRHGRIVAVLVSPGYLAALEETVEVLSNRDTSKSYRTGTRCVSSLSPAGRSRPATCSMPTNLRNSWRSGRRATTQTVQLMARALGAHLSLEVSHC